MSTPTTNSDDWQELARKLDWELSYVDERQAFPEAVSGRPWLPGAAWRDWDEPYRTTYRDYVRVQHSKEAAVRAVRELLGGIEDAQRLDRSWLSAVKLHSATLPLAEFAAVIGNLRAARFGRDSAWRTTATYGALDELRHTQIPLSIMHELVHWDLQFDWTHRFFHSDDWVAVAARHMVDELLLVADPIELAIATNFVFETGFTNLQFVGLASMARRTGDRMFEKLAQSIQTDEARHAQIGEPVLRTVIEHDPAYAQYLVDKWFWRSGRFFAVVTGFAMDYLTPLAHRTGSFKEFVQEWIVEHFLSALERLGLQRPWYWDSYLQSLDFYHHMLYASAYSYRATVWFDLALPGPDERAWLREKYPASFAQLEPIWQRASERWQAAGPGVEWYVHGTTPVGFCELCQLVLCGGSPRDNSARVVSIEGQKRIFCSEPCEWIFRRESERYTAHEGIVRRILSGKAPANLIELLTETFQLTPQTWGRDLQRGDYSFLVAPEPEP